MDERAKPIQITSRDKRILETVREYGLVSTEQLRYLHFPSFSRARKRMLVLTRYGLVTRIDRPVRMGEGTKFKLYRITTKGRQMLGESQTKSIGQKRARPVSPQFAEHQLAINRFRICLELAVAKRRGVSLLSWKPDRQVVFQVPVGAHGHSRSASVIPDGTFRLWSGNSSLSYFLEADRGTMRLPVIKAKLLAYLELFQSAKPVGSELSRGFRVLIVTESERRSRGILSLIQRLPHNIRRVDIFLVTDSRRFRYENPEQVFEPIWASVMTDRIVAPQVPLIPTLKLPTVSGNNPVYGQPPNSRL